MVRKIRVLQVIDQIGNAGAEVLQATFAESLDRNRFELHACGLRPRPGSISLPVLQAYGVPVLQLNQRASYDLPALLAIVRYIRRHHIDIIHTHLLAGDVMGRLAGFLTRRPVVSTIHSSRADLDEEPRRRQWLERQTAHLWCRRLVVVSDLLREETAAWFAFPSNRVVAIPNAVNTERFARGPEFDRAAVKAALGLPGGPLITNTARLMPSKGQRYLLDAARIVVAVQPAARFAILGEGALRAELEAQITALGLADHVYLLGFRPDVSDILAASDLFVLSSLWEGMPIALLEAQAAGCPVVATAVGGTGQGVQDGVTGRLVPPADPPALAAAILACLADPPAARALGAAGQAHVRARYGMRAWARRHEALYLHELKRKA